MKPLVYNKSEESRRQVCIKSNVEPRFAVYTLNMQILEKALWSDATEEPLLEFKLIFSQGPVKVSTHQLLDGYIAG